MLLQTPLITNEISNISSVWCSLHIVTSLDVQALMCRIMYRILILRDCFRINLLWRERVLVFQISAWLCDIPPSIEANHGPICNPFLSSLSIIPLSGFSLSKIHLNKNGKIKLFLNFLVIQGTLSPGGPNLGNIVITQAKIAIIVCVKPISWFYWFRASNGIYKS